MKNTESSISHGVPGPEFFEKRIGFLSGFMTAARAQRLSGVLEERTRYMTVCLENIYHPQNASALIRHCDAFGIQDIYTIEQICRFRPNRNIVKGTDQWVTMHRNFKTHDAIDNLRGKGYRIIATMPHQGDCPPEEFDIEAGPFALVFGTEHEGVSKEIAALADGHIRILMWGFVDSLNVSASAAIILYMLSKRLRESELDWKLPEEEKKRILFDWMMRSLRNAEMLLSKYRD